MFRPLMTAVLTVVLAAVVAVPPTTAVAADPVSLFDGKSLDGWKGRGDLWSVKDGEIVGRTTAENPIKNNTFLIWQGDAPQDFELNVTYWIESGNGGIQYRSQVVDEKEFIVGGYQADIESTNQYTGINYEERGRGILATRGQRVTIDAQGEKHVETFGDAGEIAKGFHQDGWNHYRVVAQGNRLQHYINDQLTSEVIDEQSDRAAVDGVIALQLHVGPAMVIRFKDLSLKSL